MIWFTSDEHYGHRNVIDFCGRPFTDIEHMRVELIRRHNEVVKAGDLVYHLGDMFWRSITGNDAEAILSRLKGNHYYIRGNHEEVVDHNPGVTEWFEWVKERAHIKPEGGPKAGIVLDHYAGRVWNKSTRGSWQLYGHSHGELPELETLLSIDVGVDANNWYPVSITQVAERMNRKLERLKPA